MKRVKHSRRLWELDNCPDEEEDDDDLPIFRAPRRHVAGRGKAGE